jgi:excisionase family DNA binding protein
MAERPEATGAPVPRLLLDVEEVAEVLHCGRTQVFTLLRRQELLGIKVGGLTRVPVAVVEQFVARKIQEAEAARQVPSCPATLLQWRGRR